MTTVKVIVPSGAEIECEVEYIHRDSNTLSIHPVEGFFPWDQFSDADGYEKLIGRITKKLTDVKDDGYFNISLSARARSFFSMLATRDKIPLGEQAERILEQVAEDWYRRNN